jgi:hypothetical protein
MNQSTEFDVLSWIGVPGKSGDHIDFIIGKVNIGMNLLILFGRNSRQVISNNPSPR